MLYENKSKRLEQSKANIEILNDILNEQNQHASKLLR